MKKAILIATLGLAATLGTIGNAGAQVAGATALGVTITESSRIALGWSAKKSILGKTVYNDSDEKIGKVEDLIIAPDKSVSYLIIGAGGFVGIGRHDVAVPSTQIEEQNGRLVMAGASKEVVKAMPRFEYADDSAKRDRFIAGAERDITKAKAKLSDLEGKAVAASTDARSTLDKQAGLLQKDVTVAEGKLSEMKNASAKRWKEFEADVSAATLRLRKWLNTATG